MMAKNSFRFVGTVLALLLLLAAPASAEITGVTLKTSRNVSFY